MEICGALTVAKSDYVWRERRRRMAGMNPRDAVSPVARRARLAGSGVGAVAVSGVMVRVYGSGGLKGSSRKVAPV